MNIIFYFIAALAIVGLGAILFLAFYFDFKKAQKTGRNTFFWKEDKGDKK